MLLPGVVVQKGVVLGSGSLGAEDYVYPWRSVWVGLKEGNALQIAPSDSSYASKSSEEFLTPFAKAFIFIKHLILSILSGLLLCTILFGKAMCIATIIRP